MAVYTVFEPPVRSSHSIANPERFVFVRDCFLWSAFLLGPLWMIWQRLWLVFIFYILGVIAIGIIFRSIGAGSAAQAFTIVLIALLIGLEASSLRRWTLLRKGWRELGTVAADDLDSAEHRFFNLWLAAKNDREVPQTEAFLPPVRPASEIAGVLGLFPEPGGRR